MDENRPRPAARPSPSPRLARPARSSSASAGRRERGSRATTANPHPLLGITGNIARFKGQTGQDSSVDQAFLGWGQGQTYGAPFAALFDLLGPIPMLHLGTGGGVANRKETITPQQIAEGKGDSYLVALNHAIASWGKAIYVRPMAEMNNFNAFYGGFNAERQAERRRLHAGRSTGRRSQRIYVILHGGTTTAVNAKLQSLGLPAVQGDGAASRTRSRSSA